VYDRDLTLQSLSAFGEANLSLHRLLDLSLGVRADRFTGTCRRLGPETTADPCTPLDAVSNVSPKIAAKSQLLPWLELRASYAEGFALPAGNVKYAPGAQSLSPNTIRQVEAGGRITGLQGFELDVVAYRVISSNEFTAVAPGEFANFGRTRRTGIEASLNWQPAQGVDLRVAYGYAESRVQENSTPLWSARRSPGCPITPPPRRRPGRR
jgi:outer membrane receptor protein involved in Fe transport